MKCCIPLCASYSGTPQEPDKTVSFHMLPTDEALRRQWINAINREPGWLPTKYTRICSKHFEEDCFYKTQKGLKKIKQSATPTLNIKKMGKKYTDLRHMPVCRSCLATDCKLYNMKKYKLKNYFHTLTGSNEEDRLPQKLCVMCARSLDNCVKFRDKSRRADNLLNELLRQHDSLTIQNIKSIDRDKHKLNTITIKNFEADHYDFEFEHGQVDTPNVTEEVKTESDDNDDDDISVKADDDFNDVDDVEHVKQESDVFPNQSIVFDCKDVKKDVEAEIVNTQEIVDSVIIMPTKNEHEDASDDNDFIKLYALDTDLAPKSKKETSVKKRRNTQSETLTRKVATKRRKQAKKDKKGGRKPAPFLNDDMKESMFVITHLTQEEQTADIEKRKESSNYRNAIFRCTECFKGFLDAIAYTTHMVKHTKQSGEYRCDICKCHFKTKHRIRTHISAYHMQKYTCKKCSYITLNRQSARQHEKWHKGTKYKCPHCDEEFVKCTTYFGHIRIKHPSDFVCSLCGFSFVSEKGIELHKKLKHRLDNKEVPEDGPTCELCNVRFVSTDALEQHIRVSPKHNTNNDGTRESNKRKYGTRTKLRERKLEIEGLLDLDMEQQRQLYLQQQQRERGGPIPCEQCGLQLPDSRAYHGHFRRMHPDKNRTNYPSMKTPCMCEVCGRIFQSQTQLKHHRTVHTGERPYKCDQCEKSFRVKHRLDVHKYVHSSEKPNFLCNLCGKNFSSASNKHRHMFIHTGLKPFKCEMCGKCFKNSTEKRAHITYVHLKKPWPKRNRGKRRPDGSRQDLLPQQSGSNSGSEMDVNQPLWPTDHIE